jgi:hypothetical protein
MSDAGEEAGKSTNRERTLRNMYDDRESIEEGMRDGRRTLRASMQRGRSGLIILRFFSGEAVQSLHRQQV